MEFTPLEQSVLEWIRVHTENIELQQQLLNCLPTDREFTGAGSYTTLEVSGPCGKLTRFTVPDYPNGPLHGPEIRSPGLEFGACSLLWLADGRIDRLEMAAYGDHFPEVILEFSLDTTSPMAGADPPSAI